MIVDENQLRQLIERGECATVEFKRDSLRPEQLAREIVALANAEGGMILLGVEDDGTLSGLTRKNTQEWLFDTVIGRYVHPAILPSYSEVQTVSGRIGVLGLSRGVSKPYVVRDKDREEVFVRAGNVTRRATREQQVRLCAAGGLLHTEILPVSGTGLDSLDRVRLDNYLRDILRDPEVPVSEAEWLERLLALGLMTTDASGQRVATIAGLVLFGIRPRRSLRQAGLRAMVFGGLDKEYQARMDVVLDGPMVGRWQVDRSERRLIDDGLIEKCSNALAPFISVEDATVDVATFRRGKSWPYPPDAVRETVINALAHRDWTRFVDIEISLYADRMEVISPGSLPNSMTVAKMLAGQRSMRNQIIAEVLRDYGYVDARGMGVRTKVVPMVRAAAGREPDFEATEDYLKTTLWRGGAAAEWYTAREVGESNTSPLQPLRPKASGGGTGTEPLAGQVDLDTIQLPLKGQNDLLRALRADPLLTYEALAKKVGVSPATVKRRVQDLKKSGRLRRVGSKKSGYWEVLSP
jgi:ATP-dependent DNA helicase RecG